MTTPSDRINATVWARRSDAEDLIGGIRIKESHQIETEHSTPLIDDLEIDDLFKDKNKEEEVGVTDFINWIV